MIAIQTIWTSWTKASRGGELAVARNRVPKRLPLKGPPDLPDVLWHEVVFGESNRFVAPQGNKVTTSFANQRIGFREIQVDWTEDSATLTYRHQSGSPERAIQIPKNRWAAIEFYERFTCFHTGNWWYEHTVANVAVLTSFDHRVFVASEPYEQYTRLKRLR